MGGKASILLVLGFSMIFLVFEHNYGSYSMRAFETLSSYFEESMAHNIAVSAANMAANQIFMDEYWDAGYSNISYQGGTFSVYVDNPLSGTTGKVLICHRPNGDTLHEHTISVAPSAVGPHMAHGDKMGPCSVIDTTYAKPTIVLTAVADYHNVNSTIVVKFQSSSFSKFAYFSTNEPSNIWWTQSDTVWGPFHTNGYLRCDNHPTFMGKVTIRRRILYHDSKRGDKPNLNGGFASGVNLPLPSDGVTKVQAAAASGVKFSGHNQVFLEFAEDSIRYKFSAGDQYTTVYGSTLAPNGVIFAENAELHIKGTVKGKYTVAASGTHGSKGIIYIDDDIKLKSDPRTNPLSKDLLGIVAKRDVYITNNAANNSGGIDIQASIYCETGGFGSEDYATRPVSGDIRLYGGLIQNVRRAVGTYSSYYQQSMSGFNKRYRYDERFKLISPPSFPGTGAYEIVSWYE